VVSGRSCARLGAYGPWQRIRHSAGSADENRSGKADAALIAVTRGLERTTGAALSGLPHWLVIRCCRRL